MLSLAFLLLVAALVFVTSLPPFCPLRLALGVPCPSCGLTRATRFALSLDFAAATGLHPLWFLVLPYVGGVAAVQMGSYVLKGESSAFVRSVWVTRTGQVLLALLVVVWIARFFGAFGGPCPV